MNYILNSPLDVQVELTNWCNHICRHCYNYWRHITHKKLPKTSLNKKQIKIIYTYFKKEKILSTTLTGGEPFLDPERVILCLDLSKKFGIKTDINSNLTLLNKQTIDRLSNYKDLAILTSLLSFDEATHDFITGKKGSFTKVVENIKYCFKKGIRINVNMVLSQENLSHIYKTAEFTKSLGVETFCATRAVPSLGSSQSPPWLISTQGLLYSLDNLIKIEEKLGMHTEILGCYPKCTLLPEKKFRKFFNRICVAGKTTLTIGPTGEVRPCSHSNKSYGNIFEDGLRKTWLRMDDWRRNEYMPEICQSCVLYESCTCGCRIEAEFHGDIKGMDSYAVPENVEKYYVPTVKKTIPLVQVKKKYGQSNFGLNKNIILRKESFGGILYIAGTRSFIPINQTAMDYFDSFSKNKIITYKDFIKNSKTKNKEDLLKVASLFVKLVKRKILVKIKKGGENSGKYKKG